MPPVSLDRIRRGLLLGCLAAGAIAAHADDRPFSVTYVEPDRFADIGEHGVERERNLAMLAAALEGVATPLLAPGQTLHIDVLDVDLAGTVRRTVPRRNLRIVTGRSDGPGMTLRYRFEAGGHVVSSGEERLFDLGLSSQLFSAIERDDPFRFEKRLFKDWLRTRLGLAPFAKG